MRTEHLIEAACVQYARDRGWQSIKTDTARNAKGVPDRLFLAPGGAMFLVEFKAPGGVLQPLQQWWRRWFHTHGYTEKYQIFDTVDAFCAWVRMHAQEDRATTDGA